MSEMSRTTGPSHWRSLQELADSDEYRLQLENEFPAGIEVQENALSRRHFLQIMSASIAMATLAGCRWPEEKIVPFVNRPAGVTPGTPLQFATTMEMGASPMSVLATSYDGRPIKIDGNPDSDLSKGAANVFAQASVLDVYDPDRSQKVLRRNGAQTTDSSWDEFSSYVDKGIGTQGASQIAVLTEMTTSPSVHRLLGEVAAAGSKVYLWEPVCRRNEVTGAALAFGSAAKTQLDLTGAKVIVDFDANLLQDHPSALRNNKQFAAGRDPESGHMNRLYCFENTFSTTGGMADHRFPTPAGEIESTVWALAAQLFLIEGLSMPARAGVKIADLTRWRERAEQSPHLAALARDLLANRGHGLLLAGLRQDAEVHALLHTMNLALGNVGKTINFLPMELPQTGTIQDLVKDLNAHRIKTLVVLGHTIIGQERVGPRIIRRIIKRLHREFEQDLMAAPARPADPGLEVLAVGGKSQRHFRWQIVDGRSGGLLRQTKAANDNRNTWPFFICREGSCIVIPGGLSARSCDRQKTVGATFGDTRPWGGVEHDAAKD